MRLEFTVPGKPVPQGGMTAFAKGNRAFVTHKKPKELGDYRARVALAATQAGAELTRAPVIVNASFLLPRPKGHYGTGRNASQLRASAPHWPMTKPDIDKLERALLDAITGVVIADDSQVIRSYCDKQYALEAPRTVVYIEELSESRRAEETRA